MLQENKNMAEKRFSLKDRAKSFVYAFHGIKELIVNEHNAWIHCCALIIVVTAGIIFEVSSYEWIAISICCGTVLAAEAFNTAIEEIVNFISPEYNNKAGRIKDLAAGGVLLTALGSAVTGGIIFIPKILF